MQFVITVVRHGNLKKMFDWSKESCPIYVDKWTDECYNDVIKLLDNNQQVCIFLRMQESMTEHDEINPPYHNQKVVGEIISTLGKQEYVEGHQFIIIETPYIKEFYNA